MSGLIIEAYRMQVGLDGCRAELITAPSAREISDLLYQAFRDMDIGCVPKQGLEEGVRQEVARFEYGPGHITAVYDPIPRLSVNRERDDGLLGEIELMNRRAQLDMIEQACLDMGISVDSIVYFTRAGYPVDCSNSGFDSLLARAADHLKTNSINIKDIILMQMIGNGYHINRL
jgi:hypothetical protein